MSEKGNSLGDFLRASRHAKGFSLRDVERETEISNAYLSQIESGKIRTPSPNILHKLATVYQVAYRDLMSLAGYPVPGEKHTTGRLAARLGPVTEEEEEELVSYLAFLRSKQNRRGG